MNKGDTHVLFYKDKMIGDITTFPAKSQIETGVRSKPYATNNIFARNIAKLLGGLGWSTSNTIV